MYVANFMVSYLVRFYLFKIILPLYQNHTPTLPKSHSDFHKITGWFSQHHWLIFTESHSDFAKIALRLYQNHIPIFTKPLADFHNITGWFWQNHTPTLPKSRSDFTKIADWFSQNHWLIFAKTRVDFEAPDCCCTVRRFKTAPSPIVRPACQKVSAVSSRACRVALTVCVLFCEKNLVLFTGSSCLAFHHLAVLR